MSYGFLFANMLKKPFAGAFSSCSGKCLVTIGFISDDVKNSIISVKVCPSKTDSSINSLLNMYDIVLIFI